MLSAAPHLWQRPERKLSTPFFPGAWPNNSTHSALAPSAEGKEPEDIEAQIPRERMTQSSKINGSSSSAHVSKYSQIDRVMAFHERMPQSLCSGQQEDYLEKTGKFLHATSSHNSGTTSYTQMTASTSPSDIIPTPDAFSPSNSLLSSRAARNPDMQESKKVNRFSFPRIIKQDKESSAARRPRSQIDMSHVAFEHDVHLVQRPSSVSAAIPGLPPLSLPSHTLSFSPESIASYFSTSDQSSRLNTTFSSGSPVSPSSFTQSASLSSSNAAPHTYALLSSPLDTTSVQGSETRGPTHVIHEAFTPSTLSFVIDTDSPVLPTEENDGSGVALAQSPYSRHLRSNQKLAPSAADMDAFGLAASGATDTKSTTSIPTSFRSAFAAESVSRPVSMSMIDTARGHARRQSSVSLSLSMSFSEGSVGAVDLDQPGVSGRYNSDGYASRKRSFNEPPAISYPPTSKYATMSHPNEIRGTVQVDVPRVETGAGNFLTFEKVKKLGGKIKKLFRSKNAASELPREEIGVTTTTAITDVEYRSEHPIPLPRDKGKGKLVSKLPSEREAEGATEAKADRSHQSMPIASPVPALMVSNPRPLRPNSFLVIDGPSRRQSFRNSDAAITSHRQQNLRELQGPARPQALTTTNSPSSGDVVDDRAAEPTSPLRFPSRARSRTQTTPRKSRTSPPIKSRRFSLSSPQSRSKLDFFKATIIPHPPLPQTFLEAQRDNSRRASYERATSANVYGQSSVTNNHADQEVRGVASCMGRACVGSTLDHDQEQCLDKDRKRSSRELHGTHPGLDEQFYSDLVEHERTPRRSSVRARVPTGEGDITGDAYEGSPKTPKTQSRSRRSRGFSLSSAISSTALKAKSILLGRSSGLDPDPRFPGYLSPDALTQPRSAAREGVISPAGSSVGCAEYEPDLVLENISFAHTQTSGAASSSVSSAHSEAHIGGLSEPIGGVHAILTEGVGNNDSVACGTGEEGEDEVDEIVRMEEREEERGFMRALGLEFDEIARRTTAD